MSLHHAARHLESRGRNGDSVLVHMTPAEVGGLQALALQHGGSLTINPHTGLPEANIFKKLLPTLIGIAGNFIIPGAGTALGHLATAGLGAVANGAVNGFNWQNVVGGGIGALSGQNLAAGVAKAAGTNVATDAAAKAAAEKAATTTAQQAATQAAVPAAGSVVAPGMENSMMLGDLKVGMPPAAAPVGGMTEENLARAFGNTGPATAAAAPPAGGIVPSVMDRIGKGVSDLGTNASTFNKGLTNLAMSPEARQAFLKEAGIMPMAGALTSAAMTKTKHKKEEDTTRKPLFYVPGMWHPGEQSANYGQPGVAPLTGQGFDPGYFTNDNPFSGKAPAGYTNPWEGYGGVGIAEGGAIDDYAEGGEIDHYASGGDLAGYINNINTSLGGKPSEGPPNPQSNNSPLGGYLDAFNQQLSAAMPKRQPAPYMDFPAPLAYRNPYADFTGGGVFRGPQPAGLYPNVASKAEGGSIGDDDSLGHYSDGGRLLRGPGDGVSDDIPAMIHNEDGTKQEARLANGEFVFPARIVSEIGNGSTDAGAQKLYAVMDKIQKDRARTIKDVALDTNAERHFESLMA